MDIATLVVAMPADTGVSQTASANKSAGGDLGGFINTLVDAVRKVRDNGNVSVKKDDIGLPADEEIVSLDDIDAALAALPYMQSLNVEDRQAMERIAVMVTEGGLDSEMLSELDQADLDELTQWVLSGAGGLFPEFNSENAGAESGATGNTAQIADFGLGEAAKALLDLAGLEESVTTADTDSESLPKLLASLFENGQEPDITGIDNIAKHLTEGIEELAAKAGLDTEELSLRDILKQISETDLRELLESALQAEGATEKLQQLPEVVVKSLCIEVLNIDNMEIDAGDKRLDLLNALDNNQALREEILRQVTAAAQNGEFEQSFDRLALERAVENLVGLTPEEEAELTKALNAEVDNLQKNISLKEASVNVAVTDAATESAVGALGQEGTVKVLEGSTGTSVKLGADNSAQAAVDANSVSVVAEEFTGQEGNTEGDLAGGGSKNQAAAVDPETAVSVEDNEIFALETEVITKDELTGKDFNPQVVAEDQTGSVINDTATVDKESVFESQTTPGYSNMAENVEKIEKLLRLSSGNNLKNITLQLTPDELGKITINVEYRDGVVHTTIKTENETARDLLLNGSEQLRKNLEANGVKIETFAVDVQREGYGDSQERNRESWNAAQEERDKRRRNRDSDDVGDFAEEKLIENFGNERLGIIDGSVNLIA